MMTNYKQGAFLQSSNARNISASALKQSTQTPNLFKLITKMPFTNTSPPLSATAGEGQPRTSSVLEHRAAALSHPNARATLSRLCLSPQALRRRCSSSRATS